MSPIFTEARKSDWPLLLGLALASGVLFFYRLGVPGLMDPDEGRYAEIAREMLVLKDWLVPHLNYVPYLEKPPLVYWLTALSFKIFGYTEWAARLPAALAAAGGVGLAYGLGRTFWGPGPAFWGAMILATAAGYVALGRLLILDMPLSFFLNLGIALGYLALSRGRRELFPWAYLALALGVLVKGPVALALPALIWGAWIILTRQASGRDLLHWPALLLLAAVTLPWFLAAAWRVPEFTRFFLVEQHLGRFLTPAIHGGQPWYFYGPVLMALMLPWSFLLPWALARKFPRNDPDRLFLWLWAGVVLVFFSLSRGKLIPYILPGLLPLALLLGEALDGVARTGFRWRDNWVLTFILALWALAAAGAAALYYWPPAFLAERLAPGAFLAPFPGLGLAILALIPLTALGFRNLGVLGGVVLVSALIPLGMDRVSEVRSPRPAGQALRAEWQPGAALVGVKLYSQGLSFYSGQPAYLVGLKGELDFGFRVAPEKGFFLAGPRGLEKLAQAHRPLFLYLKSRDRSRLEGWLPGDYQLLARYKDCILLRYERK